MVEYITFTRLAKTHDTSFMQSTVLKKSLNNSVMTDLSLPNTCKKFSDINFICFLPRIGPTLPRYSLLLQNSHFQISLDLLFLLLIHPKCLNHQNLQLKESFPLLKYRHLQHPLNLSTNLSQQAYFETIYVAYFFGELVPFHRQTFKRFRCQPMKHLRTLQKIIH